MSFSPKDFGYLSIVIPVYNEEENIAHLIDAIDTSLSDYDYEIILVDDFSTDNTRYNITKLQSPHVTLIELRKNYGQSLAIAAGFDLFVDSLFTTTSNKTLPSPIILGVTVITTAASLKVSAPSPPETGICSPCLIVAV